MSLGFTRFDQFLSRDMGTLYLVKCTLVSGIIGSWSSQIRSNYVRFSGLPITLPRATFKYALCMPASVPLWTDSSRFKGCRNKTFTRAPGRGEPRRPVLAFLQFPTLCVSEEPTTYTVTNFRSINIASFTRVSLIEVKNHIYRSDI